MVERRNPLWVKEATEKVMHYKKRGKKEIITLDDCDGRFLADSLVADHDVPPFDRSLYDGFALRAEDTIHAAQEMPITFQVIEKLGAGNVSMKHVNHLEAIRIMTGAQIPTGADCVIMLELVQETETEVGKFITIKHPLKTGDNISFQGEDTQKGSPLINQGVLINPGIKALLATFGYSHVTVGKKPLIGIIVTGSELLRPEDDLVPGKIRNSNGFMIESQVIRAGGLYKRYGTFTDDLNSLKEVVEKAFTECDIVITTGGVSVGDYDYLPEIYRRMEATILFNKIAMRPGSVTSCGEKNGKLLFGLSGNPSACYIGFELFIRPYIRYWLASDFPYLRRIKGTLMADFQKPNPFSRFVRSRMIFENGKIYAEPVGVDKSGVVTSLAWADCLVVLPGGTTGYKKGVIVDILLLDDQQGSEEQWQEELEAIP